MAFTFAKLVDRGDTPVVNYRHMVPGAPFIDGRTSCWSPARSTYNVQSTSPGSIWPLTSLSSMTNSTKTRSTKTDEETSLSSSSHLGCFFLVRAERPPRPEPQQAAIWAPPTPTPTRQRNFGGWVQESRTAAARGDA